MYAQIIKADMRVNLIGGVDEGLPIEHPEVICVDIGDRTDVKVYMRYDSEAEEFFDEALEPILIKPMPTMEEYLIDLDFRVSMIELGL